MAEAAEQQGEHAIDPVCGMTVDPATTEHHHDHEGADYYFCSGRCAEKFSAAPGDYLGEAKPKPQGGADDIHICPMHPEVKSATAGRCPDCGMNLV